MNKVKEIIVFCLIVFALVSVVSINISAADDQTTTTSTIETTTTTIFQEPTTTTTIQESTTTTTEPTTTTIETTTTVPPTTTTILLTCDVTASDVTFNSLAPGNSDTKDTTVSQVNGNTAATLEIKGQDWNPFMHVGQTSWYTTSSPLALTTDFAPVGALNPNSPIAVHLSVSIPPHQSSGSYTQEITFEAVC